MRIAWFSPFPPTRSGIAAYSAELLPFLAPTHAIDTFVDRPPAEAAPDGHYPAHDFVWRHRRHPYDLTVYQLGNASCHDYMWAYLFRYPGLVVLHDAQLHQARALWLTRRWQPREEDYRAEFHANHPQAPASIALLVEAGLGGQLYPHWPLVKLVVEHARLVVVHNRRVAADLRERHPAANVEWFEMGVADARETRGRLDAAAARRRHGIPADAIVLSAFGGVTEEKRIGELLVAVRALAAQHPRLRLLLVGGEAPHFDVRGAIAGHGLEERVHLSGFVPDAELPTYLLASDICSCLRWPTNRETSASWLRCLSAGTPTIVTDLTHLGDVPTLDPRDWRRQQAAGDGADAAIAVGIDVLDETHSLTLAVDRLAGDARLRQRLGTAARAWWERHHRLEPMAEAYEQAIRLAATKAAPPRSLPPHLTEDGVSTANGVLTAFGLDPLP